MNKFNMISEKIQASFRITSWHKCPKKIKMNRSVYFQMIMLNLNPILIILLKRMDKYVFNNKINNQLIFTKMDRIKFHYIKRDNLFSKEIVIKN